MSGYGFDTDVLSAVVRPAPPLVLIRWLAVVPAAIQFTTAITLGELMYGALGRKAPNLMKKVRELVEQPVKVLPIDEGAAELYAHLRTELRPPADHWRSPIFGLLRSRWRVI